MRLFLARSRLLKYRVPTLNGGASNQVHAPAVDVARFVSWSHPEIEWTSACHLALPHTKVSYQNRGSYSPVSRLIVTVRKAREGRVGGGEAVSVWADRIAAPQTSRRQYAGGAWIPYSTPRHVCRLI